MQIDKPGRYRMRNGDVAVVTAVCADHIWGYAENSDEKILRWWFADGRIMSNRDTHCDLIARIEEPDEPQPPNDSDTFGRVLGAQDEARELALGGEHDRD